MTEIDVTAVRVRAEAAQEVRDQALYALSYGDDGHRKFWEPADASARDVPPLLAAYGAANAAVARVEALPEKADHLARLKAKGLITERESFDVLAEAVRAALGGHEI